MMLFNFFLRGVGDWKQTVSFIQANFIFHQLSGTYYEPWDIYNLELGMTYVVTNKYNIFLYIVRTHNTICNTIYFPNLMNITNKVVRFANGFPSVIDTLWGTNWSKKTSKIYTRSNVFTPNNALNNVNEKHLQ